MRGRASPRSQSTDFQQNARSADAFASPGRTARRARLVRSPGDGRRLRIKQFCYDWAPPSGGIAGLWGTASPTPFQCGGAVGWLGTDYKDNRGGVVQRDRTQIECSVIEGRFADAELRRLLDGLTPADPAGARAVRGVPFHRLNYRVRYRCRPPGPSHGLWDHSPALPYDESVRCAAPTEATGGWEAFWSEGDARYAVWIGPSRELDGDGARAVLAGLAPP